MAKRASGGERADEDGRDGINEWKAKRAKEGERKREKEKMRETIPQKGSQKGNESRKKERKSPSKLYCERRDDGRERAGERDLSTDRRRNCNTLHGGSETEKEIMGGEIQREGG